MTRRGNGATADREAQASEANSGSDGNGLDRLQELAQRHSEKASEVGSTLMGKNKGGRPRKDGLKPGSPEAKAADARAAEPVPELFTPATVAPIVRLPFLFAAGITKSDLWRLEADEEKILADTGAPTLNLWLPGWNPKWAALTAFSFALMAVAGTKMVLYLDEKKAAKVKKDQIENQNKE